MNRILMVCFLTFVGLNFSGCGEEDPRTVDYFENNIEVAKSRVDECKKMERQSEKVKEDCNNAKMAIEFKKHRNLNF